MELQVAFLPKWIDTQLDLSQCCVVVVDVLRATTVMATAGAAGARDIVTCAEIDEARKIASESSVPILLCGERDCVKIDGFDCGNSPAEYTVERVHGKRVILTTTNGTAAIERAAAAQRMLCGSLVNAVYTALAVLEHQRVCIVCAGTNGEITQEDVIAAGAITSEIVRRHDSVTCDDSAQLACAAWNHCNSPLRPLSKTIAQSRGGKNLMRVGYGEDIARCARLNTVYGIVERTKTGPPTFQFRHQSRVE